MAPTRSLLAGLLASLLLLPLPTAVADDTSFAARMPDANYRECVTAKLGLEPTAEPTEAQLAGIVDLSCTGRGIADATGTDLLPNLTKLFLGRNELTTAAPIADASRLRSLGLADNDLTDLSPLTGLNELTNLDVAGNRLRDVAALGSFRNAPLAGTRHGQRVTGSPATVGAPALAPTLVGRAGSPFAATPPSGVTVADGAVTYADPGTYTWTFRDQDDLFFNGSVTVEVAGADPSLLPDPALKGCVNARLGRPAEAEPTAADLAGLTGTLTCNGKGVTNLTGITHLTGLTTLTLNDNQITDVAPLAKHPSLVTVNLKNNGIQDLTGLSSLPRLKTLDLTMNDVSSLASMGSNSTLYTLRVGQTSASTHTKLTTLAGAERLTGLGVLNVNHTALRNLAPLAGHPALATLDAENARLDDIGALAGIATLNRARLSGNHLRDLSALTALPSGNITATGQTLKAPNAQAGVASAAPLVTAKDGTSAVATAPEGVTVTDGQVTFERPGSYTWTFAVKATQWDQPYFSGAIAQHVDEAPVPVVDVEIPDAGLRGCLATAVGNAQATDPITAEQLGDLSEVSCVGRSIVDLSGAEHLTGTTSLILSSNQIADLTPLSGLTELERLLVPGNLVQDVSPLAGLSGLTTLSLSQNPVSSISALAPLTGLTDLEVTQRTRHDHADLASLDGVQQMAGLQRLVANNSSLTDLAPVAGLTNLTRLYVSGNTITDLTPLTGLTKLTHLGLASNQIESIAPLRGLTALESLDLATNRIADLSPLEGMPSQAYMGLKARWQTAQVAEVPANMAVAVPRVVDHDGSSVPVQPPAGVTVEGARVTYRTPGTYTWTFSARTDLGEHFSGTVTQPVGDPVADPADIPDPALRACVAAAAGLAPGTVPTTEQAAAVSGLVCRDAGVSDLTGLELLTNATTLDLAGNPLPGLTQIAGLTGLQRLDLSRTGLTSLAGLGALTGLDDLRVDGNGLTSLAGAPSGLVNLSAVDQAAGLPDTPGDAVVSVPQLTGLGGVTFAAVAPSAAEVSDGGVVFPLAGDYRWRFASADGAFTGVLTQRVTSDRVDAEANAPAADCVAAGNVWVTIERDTGLRDGGCATEFATGLEALASAGFTATMGGSLLTAIDGYPGASAGNHYWSYWQAEPTGDPAEYPWVYAMRGPAEHEPRPGSVEGWRFVEWVPDQDAPAPSWRLTLSPTATPSPTSTPTPGPSATPTPGPSTTPTPGPSTTPTPSVTPTADPGPQPTPAPTITPAPTPTAIPDSARPSAQPRPGLPGSGR